MMTHVFYHFYLLSLLLMLYMTSIKHMIRTFSLQRCVVVVVNSSCNIFEPSENEPFLVWFWMEFFPICLVV